MSPARLQTETGKQTQGHRVRLLSLGEGLAERGRNGTILGWACLELAALSAEPGGAGGAGGSPGCGACGMLWSAGMRRRGAAGGDSEACARLRGGISSLTRTSLCLPCRSS